MRVTLDYNRFAGDNQKYNDYKTQDDLHRTFFIFLKGSEMLLPEHLIATEAANMKFTI